MKTAFREKFRIGVFFQLKTKKKFDGTQIKDNWRKKKDKKFCITGFTLFGFTVVVLL